MFAYGQLRGASFEELEEQPSSNPSVGRFFYDIEEKTLKYYNGESTPVLGGDHEEFNGWVTVGGRGNIRTITSSDHAQFDDDVIVSTPTKKNIELVLPDPTLCKGKKITVIHTGQLLTSYTATQVHTVGGFKINDTASGSVFLSTRYDCMTFFSSGSAWHILESHQPMGLDIAMPASYGIYTEVLVPPTMKMPDLTVNHSISQTVGYAGYRYLRSVGTATMTVGGLTLTTVVTLVLPSNLKMINPVGAQEISVGRGRYFDSSTGTYYPLDVVYNTATDRSVKFMYRYLTGATSGTANNVLRDPNLVVSATGDKIWWDVRMPIDGQFGG